MPKQILVLGGSGYIGKAICELLGDSDQIYASYNLNKVEDHKNIRFHKCNLLLQEDLKKFQGWLHTHTKYLDGVVVAIGAQANSLFRPNDQSKFNFIDSTQTDMNLFNHFLELMGPGVLNGLNLALPLLKNSGNPNVLFIGSLMGIKAVPGPVTFAASKSMVRGMVESLSKEWGPSNIKVNSIDPGILEGGSSELLSPELKKDYLHHCCLRRFGKATEVANVVQWFLHDNTFITGKSILLDGGL